MILMERAEYDFNISVELIKRDNSYWTPTPLDEVQELDSCGIIDIGDDQSDFEKLISLVHEVGHVIRYNDKNLKSKNWHTLFEESLAWYLGYDYAIKCDIEIASKTELSTVKQITNTEGIKANYLSGSGENYILSRLNKVN